MEEFLESNYPSNFSDEMSTTTTSLAKFLAPSTLMPSLLGEYDDDGNGNFSQESDDYSDSHVFYIPNPEDMLNPAKRNPSFYHIVITHAVTFVIGIVGNLVAVFVMVGDRKSRNATNLFLVSLAVADILLLALCVPLEMLQYFLKFDDNGFVCKMAKYVLLLSASASVLNLCAVSLERFIVIVFPMRSRSLCTISNCRKAIVVVWVGASIISLPVLLSNDGFMMTYKNNVTSVKVYYCETSDVGLSFAVYQFGILFFAPGILMVVCYFFVIRELWRSTRNIQILTNSQSFRRADHHKLMKGRPKTDPTVQPNNSNVSIGMKENLKRVITPAAVKSTSASGTTGTAAVPTSSASVSAPATILTVENEKSKKPPKKPIEIVDPSSSSAPAPAPGPSSKPPPHYHKSSKSSRRAGTIPLRGNKGDEVKKARRQVIKMLILVIVLFLICWGPKLILAIFLKLAVIFKLDVYSTTWYNLRVTFSLIPFIHSCINPIIYSFMSKNFRRAMARQFGRVAAVFGCKRAPKPAEGTARTTNIPLRSVITKTRKNHGGGGGGPEATTATFSSNYYSVSEAASTRHTEIHAVSTI